MPGVTSKDDQSGWGSIPLARSKPPPELVSKRLATTLSKAGDGEVEGTWWPKARRRARLMSEASHVSVHAHACISRRRSGKENRADATLSLRVNANTHVRGRSRRFRVLSLRLLAGAGRDGATHNSQNRRWSDTSAKSPRKKPSSGRHQHHQSTSSRATAHDRSTATAPKGEVNEAQSAVTSSRRDGERSRRC